MTTLICPICGNGKLREEVGDFNAEFKDDSGRTQKIVVHEIKKNVCDSCGEYVLDDAAEEKISAAQRTAMGLLPASELETFRKSLGKSQDAMSELLGLGSKTWCRWESNDYFQSEAHDRYLRLLMFAPANVRALEIISSHKEGLDDSETLAKRFPHVRDVKTVEAFGREFNSMLRSGAFKST